MNKDIWDNEWVDPWIFEDSLRKHIKKYIQDNPDIAKYLKDNNLIVKLEVTKNKLR